MSLALEVVNQELIFLAVLLHHVFKLLVQGVGHLLQTSHLVGEALHFNLVVGIGVLQLSHALEPFYLHFVFEGVQLRSEGLIILTELLDLFILRAKPLLDTLILLQLCLESHVKSTFRLIRINGFLETTDLGV